MLRAVQERSLIVKLKPVSVGLILVGLALLAISWLLIQVAPTHG